MFGCVAYTHVAKERSGKLDENAKRGIFVGYTPTTRQYRVFDPQKRTIELHTSVRFNETKRGRDLLPASETEEPTLDLERLLQETEKEGDMIVVQLRQPRIPKPEEDNPVEPEPAQEQGTDDVDVGRRSRSGYLRSSACLMADSTAIRLD